MSAMIDAYLAACRASGERPKEELAAALGGEDSDSCFRLSNMALVRLHLIFCPLRCCLAVASVSSDWLAVRIVAHTHA